MGRGSDMGTREIQREVNGFQVQGREEIQIEVNGFQDQGREEIREESKTKTE